MSTVLRAHQTAGLSLPWLPTLPTKFIAMTVCVDWTVFLMLTSPFNPQPLWNPALSAVDLGVPSFIYLIKHLSLVQHPRMQKHHLCPGTATQQFPPLCSGLCSFPQPIWGRTPPPGSRPTVLGQLPVLGLLPCSCSTCPASESMLSHYSIGTLLPSKKCYPLSLSYGKLDRNRIDMTLTLHISMELFFSLTSDLLIVKEA